MPKLPRASSSAESNADDPIRSDGGVFCTDFQSCLQRRSLSALQTGNDHGTNSAAQCPQICHCEAPKGPWRPEREARGSALGVQSREGRQLRFRRGFPVIHSGTARLPRRFAPRNDNSGASTILSATCTNCQFSAGRGMPLPYNARLETSCNFTLSTFHFPLAPCRTDNDRPHPDRRGRSFSAYLPYRRSYIVFMRRRRWASSAVSRPGCSRQLQLRSLSVPGVFMRASAPRPR